MIETTKDMFLKEVNDLHSDKNKLEKVTFVKKMLTIF